MPSSIALLIVLIFLLIVVTYFHEMRSESRATGTGERMKHPVFTCGEATQVNKW